MYKTAKEQQLTFDGFNQSCGMKLNPKDEYVILADMIDWAAVEAEYSALFKSRRGRPAASARMALGSLIIQKRANLSDRRLVREIARNVSYQYFLGLQSFQRTSPVKHGVLPEFRKRLGKDFLVRVNEIFLKRANSTHAHAEDKPESPAANGNMGTMILDATCSPSNIRFPQDFSLLNEARVKLDAMIDRLHDPASGKRRPRTCRKVLRKRYLAHARLEHVGFEPYNECTILQDVVNRYKERTGHYPKRVLVDLVYRTRENRAFCEGRGIEMQKRKPGRRPKDAKERRKLEKKERRNDADRIEVERFFSVEKRCCGAGLIMTKLSETTLGSIALSVLVANLFGVQLPRLFLFYFMDAPDGVSACHMLEIEDEAA